NALERYADERCGAEELPLYHTRAKEAVDAIEAPLYGDDGILHANEYSSAACAVLCAVASDLSPTRKETFSHSAISSVSYWSTTAAAGMELRRTGDRSRAEACEKAESGIQVQLLRDICGNPFRPASVDPAGLTPTVAGLAAVAYEER